MSPRYQTLVFDIGDVLFTWSAETKTSISPKTLRQMLSTRIWNDFERGIVSQDDCYSAVGAQFGVDPREIGQAFKDARDSLRSNDALISFIRNVKKTHGLAVYAMSNISGPDYDELKLKKAEWETFERVFTSFEARDRKPDLSFYNYVVRQADLDPNTTIFVDDKAENVLSARSLGMHGIVFESTEQVIRAVMNLVSEDNAGP